VHHLGLILCHFDERTLLYPFHIYSLKLLAIISACLR